MLPKDALDSSLEMVIDLRDRNFAALLAWLIPGAGHMYQGRWGKGVLFAVCILGTFAFGMYLGEGNVVYAAWGDDPSQHRLPYVLQIGVGAPALPALVQANFDSRPFGDFMAPPKLGPQTIFENGKQRTDPDELAQWNRRIPGFELGTVYTMIAGLLNILAIFDAWGGPVFFVGGGQRREDDEPKPPGSASS